MGFRLTSVRLISPACQSTFTKGDQLSGKPYKTLSSIQERLHMKHNLQRLFPNVDKVFVCLKKNQLLPEFTNVRQRSITSASEHASSETGAVNVGPNAEV